MKVIKYKEMTKSSLPISYDDDLGVTEFRAFGEKAELFAKRVSNPFAVGAMEEIVDNIKTLLLDRKKVLDLT